jgi:hypothetical protein
LVRTVDDGGVDAVRGGEIVGVEASPQGSGEFPDLGVEALERAVPSAVKAMGSPDSSRM